MKENNKYPKKAKYKKIKISYDVFRFILLGIYTGRHKNMYISQHTVCHELYTSLLSDSVWSWVQTIVSADGLNGELGTGVGRVEFGSCEDVEENMNTDGGNPSAQRVRFRFPDFLDKTSTLISAIDKQLFLWLSTVRWTKIPCRSLDSHNILNK